MAKTETGAEMRIWALMGVAATLVLMARPVAADQAENDVRCLVVALQMAGADAPAVRAAGLTASFYWMGRVDASIPPDMLEDRMIAEVAALRGATLAAEAQRCSGELVTRGQAMTDIGKDMQRRGQEMELEEKSR
ncbi:MAG TPA: hypothetical protein VN723_08115 [Rhizomicrobium sp.]|jgi:hypothetical protein|nr:hypothetical protein [Rhizomicrobium sp.]